MNKVFIIVRENLLSEANGITVTSIRHSYDGASTLTFTRDIEFDSEPIFQLDDEIMCMVNGVTLFSGWLIDISPEMGDKEQRTYSCADARYKFSKITFKKDGSARVSYNTDNFTLQWTYTDIYADWSSFAQILVGTNEPTGYDLIFNTGKTYGDIMLDVLQTPGLIPSSVIGSIDTASVLQMNVEAPEMSFTAMSVEEVLRSIIDKAGKYGYYITTAKQLVVYQLDSLIQKNVYAGQMGQTVEAHPEYDVWQANLNFSTVDVRTKCTIEGRKKWIEKLLPLVPLWDVNLEKYWTYIISWDPVSLYNYPGAGGIGWSWPADLTIQNLSYLFRRYKYDLSEKVVALPNDGNPAAIAFYPDNTGTFLTSYLAESSLPYNPIPVDAQVDMDIGVVMLSTPAYVQAGTIYDITWVYTNTYQAGLGSKFLAESVPVSLRAMTEGTAFSVTIGPLSTSYSYYDPWEQKTWTGSFTAGDGYTTYHLEDELYIYDEEFIYEEHLDRYDVTNKVWTPAGVVRDDSGKMAALAVQVLEGIKDIQSSGTIKLDSIKTDWEIGNSVNIQNLTAGLWNNLNAVVLAVEWNLTEEESTTLTISTKQYIGGSPNYEELKRRILISQKIKDMEARIAALEQSGSGSSNSSMGNTGNVGDEGASIASGDALDFASIRKNIQAAMDENYFTIQKHDHTSDAQGGSAFAGKGGYLL